MTASPAPLTISADQIKAALKALGLKSVCGDHGPSKDWFCDPCRVDWTHAAAVHLRDLVGGDVRDLAAYNSDAPDSATIPTTLAEAADEVDAFAAAIKNGDIS